jgi:hypothetical protein
MTPTPPPSLRARAFVLSVVLWAFGLATTTLLVGVWGRSVTSDATTLSDSALAALDPDTVSDQIVAWMEKEAGSLPGMPRSTTVAVIRGVASSPPARVAVESVVKDIIGAAAAPAGSETVIDVASAIEPLRPVVVASLEESGIPASPAEVDGFLRQIEGLVLTSRASTGATGAISTARATLTTVMLVGAAGLIVFATFALRLSDDPSRMLRSLANRLIVSSLTFALFLRIGAWAVDPRGGRSPLRASGAILLASNTRAVMAIAAAGFVVSIVTSAAIRRVRRFRPRRDSTPTVSGRPDPAASADPVTRPRSAPERTRHRASAR